MPARLPLTLPFPDPPLADAVVGLRPWRADDVAEKFRAYANPLNERFAWPHARAYTRADAEALFLEQARDRRQGVELSLAVVAPGAPEAAPPHGARRVPAILGGIALHTVSREDRIASVGYWLGAAARGRGVATHAVRLLAAWAFAELGVARLELTTAPDNLASQRVAERCGFTREALMRSHLPFKGGLRDSLLYSLLPGDPV